MLIAPKKRRREEPTPKVCASSADPKPAASSASQEPIDVADTPGKRVQIESASLGEADGADALNEEDEKQQQEREEREDDELLDRVERRRQENSRMSQLYADFSKVATEEQIARFEQYKRSKFPRAAMKKLMTDVVGTSTERCAIVLASIAKMFVGEIVETAVEAMSKAGESGPLQPHHLRAAYRQARRAGTVPCSSTHRPVMFWHSNSGP
uniref:Transcription initiation factor TFIID subunit 11 n=1 Tax=Chrysotila carterae TaxID=13221 RepID=A0A7S4ETP4_CHRCT|mmetsp:Transcript_6108/g.13304  ORF Transcript_6108/g.13304 Transcript_6108/m.13304 type:complete len:211 (-) Transcript_6108:418-1050(-)